MRAAAAITLTASTFRSHAARAREHEMVGQAAALATSAGAR